MLMNEIIFIQSHSSISVKTNLFIYLLFTLIKTKFKVVDIILRGKLYCIEFHIYRFISLWMFCLYYIFFVHTAE